MHGQTPNDTDLNIDVAIVSSEGDAQIDIKALIEEFQYIMSIPKSERTPEQWDRAIEIMFLIYFNADLKALFYQLQSEIEKYIELTKQFEETIAELERIYEKEAAILSDLMTLQNNLDTISRLYDKSLENDPFLFVFSGYSFNKGLSIGVGLSFPIGDTFSIGGCFNYITNFIDTNVFAINILFGFRL
ncbi:MAG: hypothetical protein AMQ22_01087 [Candidatus Methanofastidiosum methylothiophilum]|uniref:Uncharacterized protein n=1 Tax=Candidatus Methanofastidiosum methylothiophilum TaxID=1705564 RepID=A0A150J434_9EURY|nr:MAG: hypothetical protein AMQ22_01087 [Candidatus Methanofastidiosum methylthiophilus]